MPRNLRGLRKRLGKCRGTCAACANVSANAAELARLAQTSRQMPWDLRNLRKRLGKCRGTQRDLRKRPGIPRETCGSSHKHSPKRFDRYEASVDTLPAFFHRTHVTNEAPEMADLDRDSELQQHRQAPIRHATTQSRRTVGIRSLYRPAVSLYDSSGNRTWRCR